MPTDEAASVVADPESVSFAEDPDDAVAFCRVFAFESVRDFRRSDRRFLLPVRFRLLVPTFVLDVGFRVEEDVDLFEPDEWDERLERDDELRFDPRRSDVDWDWSEFAFDRLDLFEVVDFFDEDEVDDPDVFERRVDDERFRSELDPFRRFEPFRTESEFVRDDEDREVELDDFDVLADPLEADFVEGDEELVEELAVAERLGTPGASASSMWSKTASDGRSS